MWVCVPEDRSNPNVKKFTAFTCDLYSIADWLKECKITSVAMESTGIYWIPIYQVLEEKSFNVCLVNAKHIKNVSGRPKTDKLDCQWIQRLHAYGFLSPSKGISIIRAILNGEHDPVKLAQLKNHRIKSSEEEIAKALTGDYLENQLFILKQAFEAYQFTKQQIHQCDVEIKKLLKSIDKNIESNIVPPQKNKFLKSLEIMIFNLIYVPDLLAKL